MAISERAAAARRASSERMKQINAARRGQAQASRDVTDTEILVAQLADRKTESVEDMAGLTGMTEEIVGNVGTVTHRGPVKVRLYDSEGNMRFVRSSDLAMVLKNGLFPVCPICGAKHTEGGFNACKGRDPVLFTRCDICAQNGRQKLIADERLHPLAEAMVEDPNYVPMDITLGQDAKARLRLRYQAHVRAYHENHASSMGLLPNATAGAR